MKWLNMRIIIEMDHPTFFTQGKWMPSFALLGNRQIICHHPINNQSQTSSIKTILLNPSYPSQRLLCQRLVRQAFAMTSNIKMQPKQSNRLKIIHLQKMMHYVVKSADQQTQSYHNILYLSFKYLAHLVSKKANRNNQNIDQEVTIQNWLADVHSIYFEQSNQHSNPLSQEQQLTHLFKKGQYEHLISQLRYLYCQNNSDLQLQTKIDRLISMLLIRLNDKFRNQKNIAIDQETKMYTQKQFQVIKEKLLKQCAGKSKNEKKGDEGYHLLGRVILGDEGAIQKIAENSWPVFAINLLSFGIKRKQQIIHNLITNFLRKHHEGKATTRQTQYLMFLLQGDNNHQIYQKLFEIVPPFYAHLLGYFFTLIRPTPIPTLFVQDYKTDIIRSLLEHGSQISFQCLVYLFSTFDLADSQDQRLSEMFQTLLCRHIYVIDSSDKQQIHNFLQKVRILSLFNLQRYAYSQLNFLLNNQLQTGRIDKQVLLIYAYCNMLFSNTYNYQKLLIYYLQQKYMVSEFDIDFLDQYDSLKEQLQASKEKKLLKQLRNIEPFLEKFQLLWQINNQPMIGTQIDYLSQLMQKTYKSLSILHLTKQVLQEVLRLQKRGSTGAPQFFKNFTNEAKQFIHYYPPDRSQAQMIIISKIADLATK